MKKLLLLTLLIGTLLACDSGKRTYSDYQDLSPKLEWLKKDIRAFKVPVEDKNIPYNLSLSFRYVSGYPYRTIPVKVTETSPSGKESVATYELEVVDEKGDYIGQPGYDLWDSEHLIMANKSYDETGTYTYVIEQNAAVDPLTFVMEIGVLLDKADPQ